MEPVNSMKVDAKVNFAKRMDGTSWCHRLLAHANCQISWQNVLKSEQAGRVYG
jgi:hypothetical protein